MNTTHYPSGNSRRDIVNITLKIFELIKVLSVSVVHGILFKSERQPIEFLSAVNVSLAVVCGLYRSTTKLQPDRKRTATELPPVISGQYYSYHYSRQLWFAF